MRKDTVGIIGALRPEKAEVLGKLSDLQRVDTQLKKIDMDKETIRKQAFNMIKGDGADELNEKIMAIGSVQAIEALTSEQLKELYTMSNGQEIIFNVPAKNAKKADEEKDELRKDFAVFIFNSETEIAKLDQAKEDLETIMKESDDEIKQLFNELGGDVSQYVFNSISEAITDLSNKEELTGDESKQLASLVLTRDKLVEAVTLDSVIEYVAKYDVHNIVNDYKRRADVVGEKYATNVKKIKLTVDFTAIKYLEHKFLPERFHKMPDLFTFIVMRMISTKKDLNAYDGVFLSQLAFNLRQFYRNESDLTKEQLQDKNMLLVSIQRVLGIVYDRLGE